MKKNIIIVITIILAFALCLTACAPKTTEEPGKTETPEETTGTVSPETPAEPWKIALSNSYVGNDWRQNMEKTLEFVANSDKYKDIVDLTIVNCENTAEAQSASIDAMILAGYDAILVDASSATALNEAIGRALDAGIVVVSFDQLAQSDRIVRVTVDFPGQYSKAAEHVIVNALDGRGKVILDHGMPGVEFSETLYQAFVALCNKYPDLEVVGDFQSDFAEGSILTATEDALAATPDIDAVFTGSYVNVVIDAFQEVGKMVKGVTGHPFNCNLLKVFDNDVESAFVDNPISIACTAMQIAIDQLNGIEYDPSQILYSNTNMFALNPTAAELADGWFKIEKGVNCFEDLPDGFSMPTTDATVGVDVPVSAIT